MWWKSKADKSVVRPFTFTFACTLDIDSVISDEQLPDYLLDELKKKFSAGALRAAVRQVVRDGDGVIERLELRLWK